MGRRKKQHNDDSQRPPWEDPPGNVSFPPVLQGEITKNEVVDPQVQKKYGDKLEKLLSKIHSGEDETVVRLNADEVLVIKRYKASELQEFLKD